MFEVIKFFFKCIGQVISMLFSIDIGPMSLGLFMCIIFIAFPIFIGIVNFLKCEVFDELDDLHDFHRPTESWRSSERITHNYGNGHTLTTYHDRVRRRKYWS